MAPTGTLPDWIETAGPCPKGRQPHVVYLKGQHVEYVRMLFRAERARRRTDTWTMSDTIDLMLRYYIQTDKGGIKGALASGPSATGKEADFNAELGEFT